MGLFKKPYKKISQQEAKSMLVAGIGVLVDVRRPEEFKSGHIPGARLLTLNTINETTASEVIPHKDDPVLVYCLSGGRSRTAAAKLSSLGYSNVYDIGGIGTWPYEI
ncbi:MAG: rhodanese-like domain-containing protein, partial [Firmicutes bacterium]|nr:rhodanese-like domain-containing protein [Bacillota bacterium]